MSNSKPERPGSTPPTSPKPEKKPDKSNQEAIQYIKTLLSLIPPLSDEINVQQLQDLKGHLKNYSFEYDKIAAIFSNTLNNFYKTSNQDFLAGAPLSTQEYSQRVFQLFRIMMKTIETGNGFFLRTTIPQNPWCKLLYLEYANIMGFKEQLEKICAGTAADWDPVEKSYEQMRPLFSFILKHENFKKNLPQLGLNPSPKLEKNLKKKKQAMQRTA